MYYIIEDCSGNVMFNGLSFECVKDAMKHLEIYLESMSLHYDTSGQKYYILPKE